MMGRKWIICLRRRVLHIRFIYYFLLAVIGVLLIRSALQLRSGSHPAAAALDEGEAAKALEVTSSKLCRKSKPIDIYELCYETNVGRIQTDNVLLISAESESLKLEEELPYEVEEVKIDAVFGESDSYLEKLLKILLKLPLIGHYICYQAIRRGILQAGSINNSNHYTLLKLGTLPERQERYKASIVKQLFDDGLLQRFHQLFIYINNEYPNERSSEWIEIIQLLKASNYQLFSVHRVGDCAQSSIACSFGTSWLRIDQAMHRLDEEINPLDPNYDFGGKLHSLLRTTSTSCRRKVIVPSSVDPDSRFSSASRWPVCLDNVEPPCIVYSAKIGGSELFESILARLGCEVYVFDPTLNLTTVPKSQAAVDQHIQKFNWTLGAVNAQVVSGFQQPEMFAYVKASDVLKKFGHQHQVVDILRLDLHGGEWDVLDSLIAAQQATNYQQLLMTVHVWVGEERLNLLDRLVRLKKVFGANFRVFHSEPIAQQGGESDTCCYVIGLLNNNLIN